MIDFIAMRALGDRLQNHTWSHVVDRVVEISGGTAPEVEQESVSLDDDEAAAIERWCEEIAMRMKRAENAEKIEESVSGDPGSGIRNDLGAGTPDPGSRIPSL
jgi:hypothetical protein